MTTDDKPHAPSVTTRSAHVLRPWAQILAAVAGLALATAGAVAVFPARNAAGAGSLVAAGAVVGLLALCGNRVQSFEDRALKVQLAAATLAAANEAERAGQPGIADALRRRASRYIAVADAAALYFEKIRATEASAGERTAKLERLVMSQAQLLADTFPDKAAVEPLFDSGRDGNRINAIAIIGVKPALGSERIVVDAVGKSRSAFEQWHGLKAIKHILAYGLSGADTQTRRDALEIALRNPKWGWADTSRERLARETLARLRWVSSQRINHGSPHDGALTLGIGPRGPAPPREVSTPLGSRGRFEGASEPCRSVVLSELSAVCWFGALRREQGLSLTLQ